MGWEAGLRHIWFRLYIGYLKIIVQAKYRAAIRFPACTDG